MATETALTFPFPTPDKVIGRPDYENVTTLRRKVYANAMSVQTTLGGGNHGFLGAVMPAADYAALPGTVPFVMPAMPPADPTHIPAATSAQITETNRAHLAAWQLYNTATKTISFLRQYLIGSYDACYFGDLQDELLGFANATPEALTTRLMTFAVVTADDIQRNLDKQKQGWNPDEPIEVYWQRLTDIQRFGAAANEAIPDGVIIRNAFQHFKESGILEQYCFTWKQLPIAGQTLDAFKTHFTTAVKDFNDNKTTTKAAGFHGANAATNTSTATSTTAATNTNTTPNGGTVLYYCHTHGLGLSKNHTSGSCKNPAENHDSTATIFDSKGGCRHINVGGNRPRRTNATTNRSPAAANAAETTTDTNLTDE